MADPAWVDGATPLNSANMTKLQTRDEKAVANGYASLDATGKVPAGQLPTPAASLPTGAAIDFFGAAAPAGFLLCDGTPVSRTTYAALFAVIGTTFGAGDGATTFNLPDTLGRFTVGRGTHADVTTLGQNEGIASANRRPRHAHTNGVTAGHNLTLPDHAHLLNVQNASGGGTTVAGSRGDSSTSQLDGYGTTNPTSHPAISGAVTIGGTIGAAGASLDCAPYLVVNKIIKT